VNGNQGWLSRPNIEAGSSAVEGVIGVSGRNDGKGSIEWVEGAADEFRALSMVVFTESEPERSSRRFLDGVRVPTSVYTHGLYQIWTESHTRRLHHDTTY
jgi:hypothetical protein